MKTSPPAALTGDPCGTPQERQLIDAGLADGILARALGLSFADRDVELIQYLSSASPLPPPTRMPAIQACADLLQVEPRWAEMVLERVGRFIAKAARGTDYSQQLADFERQPALTLLSEKLSALRPGTTVFIGDSNMDRRHWSCDAPFPDLAGAYLQRLGLGNYINAGIGGQTARQGLERFHRDVAAHRPVRVVIGFGGNDLAGRMPLDHILNDLDILTRQSRHLGATVSLLGLTRLVLDRLWWTGHLPDPHTNQHRRRLHERIRDYAYAQSLALLDIAALIAPEHICSDGIHLNQPGHNALALHLLQQWCEN